MTRDEVIRMARESSGPITGHCWIMNVDALMRFASLAAAAEREECAKAFEREADKWKAWPQAAAAKRKGAAAIRAREEK